MNGEEKGFVIKDRRSFDEKGEKKEGERAREETPEERRPGAGAREEEGPPPPLPEVNFPSLIFSLSSSALFHLGEIPDPASNEKRKDLPMAKHAIDTIAMLRQKTEGNLTEEERKFTESVLTDLKLRFVRASS